MVFRFFGGLAIGASSVVAPIYISEIAPPKYRGRMGIAFQLNMDVYSRTGKLMEKYNVVDTQLEAGGGEYPGQDGFGWTNGVLLALIAKYGKPE